MFIRNSRVPIFGKSTYIYSSSFIIIWSPFFNRFFVISDVIRVIFTVINKRIIKIVIIIFGLFLLSNLFFGLSFGLPLYPAMFVLFSVLRIFSVTFQTIFTFRSVVIVIFILIFIVRALTFSMFYKDTKRNTLLYSCIYR